MSLKRNAARSLVLAGVRCRVNVLHSTRGLGLAIRLLTSSVPTLTTLNLHPALKDLLQAEQGLILVTGPTGSGKTSTLAALIQELNATRAKHVVTLEHPVEYVFRPAQCFIRQREVGRDTPSVEQGLRDALREDPDVLVVGEMRDPVTMRLTLDAAETGHLVLATLHSSTAAEALQRVVNSFAPEQQPSVCAQLADVLVGVVAQRMTWRPKEQLRVPECELLLGTQATRANVRASQFFKLQTVLESSGAEGMFSYARYRDWLERKKEWVTPPPPAESAEPVPPPITAPASVPTKRPAPVPAARPRVDAPKAADAPAVLELSDSVEDLGSILKDLERKT